MGNIPLFRGVSDRTGCSASPLGSVADYPVRHSPATPSEKGNIRGVADRTGCLAPSPMPSHSGRGVGKDGDIPLFRGVSDRTGCSLPHPCPLIAGEG